MLDENICEELYKVSEISVTLLVLLVCNMSVMIEARLPSQEIAVFAFRFDKNNERHAQRYDRK